MTTVQLAIRDSEYAQSLRNLLLRDGTHRVLLVDKPDLKVEGVVVMDSGRFEDLSILGAPAERFVVITRKGEDHLTRIWEAGVRHVVFEEDSPNTAQLAVIAAELRIPKAAGPLSKEAAVSGTWAPPDRSEKRRSKVHPRLSMLDSRPQCSHCCFIQNPIRIS
jgi:hypothetical protein